MTPQELHEYYLDLYLAPNLAASKRTEIAQEASRFFKRQAAGERDLCLEHVLSIFWATMAKHAVQPVNDSVLAWRARA